jgi:hypothetical protein
MGIVPSLVPVIAFLAAMGGIWGVAEVRWPRSLSHARWSRRLIVLVLLVQAGGCLLAALTWPPGVLPFGLAIGSLFLAALWPPAAKDEAAQPFGS